MAATQVTADVIKDGTITASKLAAGVLSGKSVSWQTTTKTADFTATANEGYFVDTTSDAIDVTLPSSPSVGDIVSLIDSAGNAATNLIRITSSNDIQDSLNDFIITYDNAAVNLVYSGSTKGWLVLSAANETATAIDVEFVDVDFLVVAGGGGGGDNIGGGGGAGGLRTSYGSTSGGGSSSEATLSLEKGTDYTVTVGSGGAGGDGTSGSDGGDSVFSTVTSTGGGGGGFGSSNGLAGGSGGGGGGGDGSQSGGTGTANQGFNGGTGSGTSGLSDNRGGGGGGAGAAGSRPDAGNGIIVNILNSTNANTESVGEVSGSDVYYAGGGGGSKHPSSGSYGTGGLGGGGNGNVAGDANTGGGGGGSLTDGRSGGSGVVVLRYPSSLTLTETTSPAVLTFTTYTEGDDDVTVFTSGSNGTIQFS